MATADDIAKIIEQERGLEFTEFNENVAFSLGVRVRERAVRERLGLVVDVRTWDRQMFYAAMPGTTADNPNWVRRKINTVQRLLKSSYRVALEQNREDRVFPPIGRSTAPTMSSPVAPSRSASRGLARSVALPFRACTSAMTTSSGWTRWPTSSGSTRRLSRWPGFSSRRTADAA